MSYNWKEREKGQHLRNSRNEVDNEPKGVKSEREQEHMENRYQSFGHFAGSDGQVRG